jgi:hypothetical protein
LWAVYHPNGSKPDMDLLMKKIVSVLSLVILIGMLSSGCQKDSLCQGDIYVVRKDNGKPVVNSKVWSHYVGANNARNDIQYTDGSGHVHVNLNLPAILTITAYAPVGYPNAANPVHLDVADSTTLRFESGATNSCTIAL